MPRPPSLRPTTSTRRSAGPRDQSVHPVSWLFLHFAPWATRERYYSREHGEPMRALATSRPGVSEYGDELGADLLRQRGRAADLRRDLSRERFKKCHQVRLFRRSQVQGLDFLRLPRVPASSSVVKGHDFFEGLQAPVVHIRGPPRHIAECWRLKSP